MLTPYVRGSARRRLSVWLLCWLLLAAPLALAQPSLVKDIFPAPQPAVALNGKLYFAAFTAGTGMELYRSDLSGLNVQLVKDLTAGANPTGPVGLVNANGTLYFSAGNGLYKSDGTDAGTVLLKTFTGRPPEWLTNVNGTLYFAADNGVSGIELWKSNGTAAGTVQVKDIHPGGEPSTPEHLAALNGTVYFSANDGVNGIELWKSNGTAAGTVLVKDIYPGTVPNLPHDPEIANGLPRELTAYNGKLYFSAQAPVYGMELWRTDGTEAGTVLVKDLLVEPYITNDPLSSRPHNFRVVNNKLMFIATTTVPGVDRVFASDGTAPGTVDVGGATPAKYYSGGVITSAAVVNDAFCYATYSYASGVGPVVDFYGFNGSRSFSQEDDQVSDLTPVNGALYFVANDGMSGRELWVNNAAGIEKLPELNSGPEGTNPTDLFSIGNVLYFRSTYGTGANALWKYDLNTPPPSDLRLNAGGPDHFNQEYDEIFGFYPTTFFRADAYFTGGTTSTLPGDIGNTVIENALDPKIYLSERAGAFSYAIPAPKGRYRVTLHFAELYWGNTKAGGVGSRKFNVDLEGVRTLTNYDIFAKAGGALRAIRETFTVDVADGTLNLAFLKGAADVPKVSAIEVVPVVSLNRAPVLSPIGNQTVANGSTLSFKATATDPDGNSLTYSLLPAPYGYPFPPGATIDPTTGVFTWTASSPDSYYMIVRVT
ncbi:MAG TPA: ELWxxDGT repeat protein, partial [Cytophagales bacterium]